MEQKQQNPTELKKIPYKPVTVAELDTMLYKYRDKASYEVAEKLLVDEGLLILRKLPQSL